MGKCLPWQACGPRSESLDLHIKLDMVARLCSPRACGETEGNRKIPGSLWPGSRVYTVSQETVSNKVQGQDRHPRLSSDFTCKYTHKHIHTHGHTFYISAHTSHTPKMSILKHFIYKKLYYHYCFKRI